MIAVNGKIILHDRGRGGRGTEGGDTTGAITSCWKKWQVEKWSGFCKKTGG